MHTLIKKNYDYPYINLILLSLQKNIYYESNRIYNTIPGRRKL
jgi:hypothetical protein